MLNQKQIEALLKIARPSDASKLTKKLVEAVIDDSPSDKN